MTAQLLKGLGAGHALVLLGHLVGRFHHGGVLLKGLFHDLRVGPLFGKGTLKGANGHLALFQGAQLHRCVNELLLQGLGGRTHQVQALPVLKLQMSGAVALGQVPDGALERKARFARVCGGVGNAHDHGDHLVDVAARSRHLGKSAGHLTEAVAGLVGVPHQLVQVTVDLVNALARGVHDGLNVGGLFGVLVPAAGHLIDGQALDQLLTRVHKFVGDVHQCRGGHDVQARELGFQPVKARLHGGKVHVLRGCAQLLKALFRSLELELLHQPVNGRDGLFGIFLKICVVKPHFNNAAVYFLAHSVLTSPHARAAIRSKIGRIAGLI